MLTIMVKIGQIWLKLPTGRVAKNTAPELPMNTTTPIRVRPCRIARSTLNANGVTYASMPTPRSAGVGVRPGCGSDARNPNAATPRKVRNVAATTARRRR